MIWVVWGIELPKLQQIIDQHKNVKAIFTIKENVHSVLLRASIHDPAQPGRDGYFIPTSLPWIEILKSLHEKIYPTHL